MTGDRRLPGEAEQPEGLPLTSHLGIACVVSRGIDLTDDVCLMNIVIRQALGSAAAFIGAAAAAGLIIS